MSIVVTTIVSTNSQLVPPVTVTSFSTFTVPVSTTDSVPSLTPTQSPAIVTPTDQTSSATSSPDSNPFLSSGSSTTSTSPTLPVSTPTNTSTPPTLPASKSDRLSNAVVAGIAIATAVIGAVIAATVLCFLMKTRKKRSNRGTTRGHYNDARRSVVSTTSGQNPDQQTHLEKHVPTTEVNLVLPQPLDDETIKAEVEKFFKFIEGHVESGFYHDFPFDAVINGHESSGDRTTPLPSGILSQSGVELEELLAHPHSRPSAITSLICAETLSAIDFAGEPQRSLLPSVVTSFMRLMKENTQNTRAYRLSLSRWRTSTSFLLGNESTEAEHSHRDRVEQLLVRDLNEILRPFASRDKEQERNADLLSIFKRAEKLGLLLLSQPAEWAFAWRWNPPKSHTGSQKQSVGQPRQPLVIFPGLLRTTDNSASALDKSRIVLGPTFMR